MPRPWRGVLTVENEETGDGRVIAPGAIEWAPLPMPLGWLQQSMHGDLLSGAVQIGIIETITREGDDIVATGQLDDADTDAIELIRKLEAGVASHGSRQGLSIDPDNWAVEYIMPEERSDGDGEADDEYVVVATATGTGSPPRAVTAAAGDPDPGDDGGEAGTIVFAEESGSFLARFTRLRIRGVTACDIQAFVGGWIELDGGASSDTPEEQPEEGEDDETVTASGASAASRALSLPHAPAAAWFTIPEPQPGQEGMVDVYGMPVQELIVEQLDGSLAVPLTVLPDGRVFGHAAAWGQCHVGYSGRCVTPPESMAAYAHFHHGLTTTAEGTTVATGRLTIGCDHADAHLFAPEARDHYAHAGMGWANVRATNGTMGVWISGGVVPSLTAEQLAVVQSLSLSGDWRDVDDNLEFIAALSVNVPGFPIARETVVASALPAITAAAVAPAVNWQGDRVTSLVASGIVQRCADCAQGHRARTVTATAPVGGFSAEDRHLLHLLAARTRHLGSDASTADLARLRANTPTPASMRPAGYVGARRR